MTTMAKETLDPQEHLEGTAASTIQNKSLKLKTDIDTEGFLSPPNANTASKRNSGQGPPRPPARSPLRRNPSPHKALSDLPPTEHEPMPESYPQRQRRESEGNKPSEPQSRDQHKSGMSFVSLYDLYQEPTPAPPVPALPGAHYGAMTKTGRPNGTIALYTAPSNINDISVNNGRARSGSGASTKRSSNRMSREFSNRSATANVLPDQPVSIATIKSKRLHALFELLDTERAYSNDMTLVKSVHLPLALGLKADFGPLGVPAEGQIPSNTSLGSIASTDSTIYRSSGISATTTAVSLSQTATSGTANEPPMTVEDAKVIFANLDELAEFAGRFTEQIQSSLGSLIEGGHGLDSIGTLFLQTLPIMTPLYETYITKHSVSIARYTAITTIDPSPSMLAYVEQTKAIASTYSNSWDLNSLLIKPIQRFLKYPLLLQAILEATTDEHPDKPSLLQAKDAMVSASKLVNEQTQKAEICRTILQRKPLKGLPGLFAPTPPDSQLKTKGSKSVFAVTKAKDAATIIPPVVTNVAPVDVAFDPISLENRIVSHAGGGSGNLEELIKHLQCYEGLIPGYVRDVVNWAKSVRDTLTRLEKWSIAFERVIALDEHPGVEALDAFRRVLTERLSPILDGLETAIRTTLVPNLKKIQDSMKGPTLLLNTAASLRTVHNALLNTPFTSKTSKPAPHILEGSKTYLALMQQLRSDLPVYVRHLDRMFGFVILQVAKWQERWYREVGSAWGDLWKALEVGPGSRKEYRARRSKEIARERKRGSDRAPRNAASTSKLDDDMRGGYGCGADETAAIWWDRWEEVSIMIHSLGVPSGAALEGVRNFRGQSNTSPGENQPATQEYNSTLPIKDQGDIIYEILEPEEDQKSPFSTTEQFVHIRRNSSHLTANSSETKVALNTILPEVSPIANKKDKHSSKEPKRTSQDGGKGQENTSPKKSPANSSRGWSIGFGSDRSSKGKEKSVQKRKSEPSKLNLDKSEMKEALLQPPPASPKTPTIGVNLQNRPSFRRILTDSLRFGEPMMDSPKIEIAEQTTEVVATNGHRASSNSSSSGSRNNRVSNGSTSMDFTFPRKTSISEGTKSRSQSQHGRPAAPSHRSRPSLDQRRMSEFRYSTTSPLDFIGHAGFGDDAPILFTCAAVAASPSEKVFYAGLPFLTIRVGDVVNVLKEAGRPADHPELRPAVSDGLDTLFIGRTLPEGGEEPELGWVWASFVIPIQ